MSGSWVNIAWVCSAEFCRPLASHESSSCLLPISISISVSISIHAAHDDLLTGCIYHFEPPWPFQHFSFLPGTFLTLSVFLIVACLPAFLPACLPRSIKAGSSIAEVYADSDRMLSGVLAQGDELMQQARRVESSRVSAVSSST